LTKLEVGRENLFNKNKLGGFLFNIYTELKKMMK